MISAPNIPSFAGPNTTTGRRGILMVSCVTWNRPAAFADGSSNKMAWYEWAVNPASPASKVGTVATSVTPPLARSISATPCAKRSSLPTSKTFSGSNSIMRLSPRQGRAKSIRRLGKRYRVGSPLQVGCVAAGRIPLSNTTAPKYPAYLKHHAKCFHQNLRLPDERTRQRSRRRPACGQGLHPRAIRGGRRRDFAEHLQRARFRGAKGDWQNAKHRGGCAQEPSGRRARFHGLHGAEPRRGTH